MKNGFPSQKSPMRLPQGLIVIGMVLFSTIFGCVSGNYGNIGASSDVTETFQSYKVLPDHRYYFSGPEAQPFYIIGIQKSYALQSKLWKPIDLTPQQIDAWINFGRMNVENRMHTYGANIVGPAGEQIGVWYSVLDWRSQGTVRLETNNTVFVTIPGPGSTRRDRGIR